jgi:hypothetical protein
VLILTRILGEVSGVLRIFLDDAIGCRILCMIYLLNKIGMDIEATRAPRVESESLLHIYDTPNRLLVVSSRLYSARQKPERPASSEHNKELCRIIKRYCDLQHLFLLPHKIEPG